MTKSLVIVESPAKARTLAKFLGSAYRIEATKGHIRDLPEKRFGVDIRNGFKPDYKVLSGREKIVDHLRKAAEQAEEIFLASDPDREGEAIAWHVAELLDAKERCFRATFHEVTRKAILHALEHPERLNQCLVDAQQARRILDRLVGYKLSPLLSRWFGQNLSAGRVQSVAVRLIVERENERRAFLPQEYWSIEAQARASQPPPFPIKLASIHGQKAEVKDEGTARRIVEAVSAKPFFVESVDKREVRRKPPAPFITSTLQQEAARKLRMTTTRTMSIAQKLYEGVELGEEGAVGLITYMRTDSVQVSQEAVQGARTHIHGAFGAEYLPATPPQYRSGKAAQEAHEAIRPTDLSCAPDRVARYLSREELSLYRLIWNRFLASQMSPAVVDQTRVEASPDKGTHVFSATGQVVRFPGFLAVYEESREDDENGEDAEKKKPEDEKDLRLPPVTVGEKLDIEGLIPLQHFTKPLPRFTEATLVRELERLGIGRPSTYAAIVSTIQKRKYVKKDNGRFAPTETGEQVTNTLIKQFPEIMDVNFTARMENELDDVEQGNLDWQQVLTEFYREFSKRLQGAAEEATDFECPNCGKKMNLRSGRFGRYLVCADSPHCKGKLNVVQQADGTVRPVPALHLAEEVPCDSCSKPMVLKNGRGGAFLACSDYPECKNKREVEILPDGTVRPLPLLHLAKELPCENCGKPMVVRKGRRGLFLACSGYPDCKTTLDVRTGDDGLLYPVPRSATPTGGASGTRKTQAPGEGHGADPPPSTRTAIPTSISCDNCGKPMVVRRGRFGPFLACTGFPACRSIKKITADMNIHVPPPPPKKKAIPTDIPCTDCGKPMVIRSSRRGPFLGCTGYPKCRNAQPLPDHLKDLASRSE